MPKCNFNKVAKQLAAHFQDTFSQEHIWEAASGDDVTELSFVTNERSSF